MQFPLLGSDPSIFGRRVVTLDMQGSSLSSGWFNNDGGTLRLATGDWTGMLGDGTSISVVNYPDESSAPMCSSIGINAVDQCGNIGAGAARLDPHQLGRLWRPCDAVTSPNPPVCN